MYKARIYLLNGYISDIMDFDSAKAYAFALIRLGNIGVWVVPE